MHQPITFHKLNKKIKNEYMLDHLIPKTKHILSLT
jgi:hypothetical protein